MLDDLSNGVPPLDPKKLVFIDEPGAKTNMTRRYDRSLKGKLVVDKVSFGHHLNLTYVCGIRNDGIVAPHSFVGGMNTQRFIEYVRDVLSDWELNRVIGRVIRRESELVHASRYCGHFILRCRC